MKLKKLFVVMLVALVPVLFLAGCDDDGAVFNGTYTSTFGEEFQVTETVFGSYYSDSTMLEGTIVGTVDFTVESDRFAIEVTNGGEYGSYTVGNYTTVAWKDLDGNKVKISTAFKVGGTNDFDTSEAALTEHTVANGYFDMFSECSK